MSVTTRMGRIDSPARWPHGRGRRYRGSQAEGGRGNPRRALDDLDVMADKDQLVGAGPGGGRVIGLMCAVPFG